MKTFQTDAFQNDSFQVIPTSIFSTLGSLPIRYEIENTGTSASSTEMKQISALISIENGKSLKDIAGYHFSVSTNKFGRINKNEIVPLISIRLKSSLGTKVNKAIFYIENINMFTSKQTLKWIIYKNPALINSSWESVHNYSIMEYSLTDILVTEGQPIRIGFVKDILDKDFDYADKYMFVINGQTLISDIVTLAVVGIQENSEIMASLSWKEIQ